MIVIFVKDLFVEELFRRTNMGTSSGRRIRGKMENKGRIDKNENTFQTSIIGSKGNDKLK